MGTLGSALQSFSWLDKGARAQSVQMRVELDGVRQSLHALESLGPRVYKRVMTSALRKAVRPIVAAARAKAPKKSRSRRAPKESPTGALRRSIGYVVRKYKQHMDQSRSSVRSGGAGTILALVGPRRGFKGVDGRGRVRDPANYGHLIEFGHRIAKGGKLMRLGRLLSKRRRRGAVLGTGRVAGHVPARPFLRPAFDANKSAALAIIRQEIGAGIEREAARLSHGGAKR